MESYMGEEEKNRAGQARQLLRQSETVLCHTLLQKMVSKFYFDSEEERFLVFWR